MTLIRGRIVLLVLWMNALLFVAMAKPAHASEPCERLLLRSTFEKALTDDPDLQSVYRLVEKHLMAEGVRYTRATTKDQSPVLVITPDRDSISPLNHWAASLWERHHVRFDFDLARLRRRKAKASFSHRKDALSGTIHLPIEEILRPEVMSSSLAHEIIHSETQWRLAQREVLPFYGKVAVGKEFDELPGTMPDLVSGKRSYAKRFAFDEIQTHLGQARFLWDQIRSGDYASDQALVETKLQLARERVQRGRRMALQAERFAVAAIERVGEVKPRFKVVGSDLVVGFTNPTIDGVKVRIEIPLVESSGLKSAAKNRRLLGKQLERLRDWAHEQAELFSQMEKWKL